MTSNYEILLKDAETEIGIFTRHRDIYLRNLEKEELLKNTEPKDKDALEILEIQLRLGKKEMHDQRVCLKHLLRLSKRMLSEEEYFKLWESANFIFWKEEVK